MNEMRRVLALLLCFVMLVGMLPAGALATDVQTTEPSETVVETQVTEATDAAQETTLAAETESIPTESVEESVPATTVVTEPAETTDETTAPTEVEEIVDETTAPTETEETVPGETVVVEDAAAEEVPEFMSLTRLADGVLDAAIFFSDLHTSKSDYKETHLKGIMTALKNTDAPFSSVTSCGDAFSVNEDNSWDHGPYTGYTSTLTGYIQDVMGNVPVNYVWSDHDRYAVQEDDSTLLDNDSGFIYGAGADGTYGTADDGNYYIYELSMADLSTYNRYNADFHSNSEVTAVIADFEKVAATLKKDRPLFIASHQPLFDRRNDNGHALEWCTAINAVAENMDVAFFFGHNHKYDEAGDYYYAKGSTMSVCKDSSGNAQSVKINFTHICAGYMEPTSTGSYDKTRTRRNVAVAAIIYKDSIEYVTYDSEGVYTGSYALDATVKRDAQVADPTVTGIAITTQPTKLTYTVGEKLDTTGMVVTATYSDGSTRDVTTSVMDPYGYDMNTTGTQTVTVMYMANEAQHKATFKITVKAAEPTVNTVECWDNTSQVTVKATGLGLTAVEATNVNGGNTKYVEIFTEYGYMAVDVALTGLVAGESVKYSISVVADLDVTNLELYYEDENGNLIPVEFELVTDELGNAYVEFTTDKVGTFVYGSPVVPEGYALTSLVMANIPRDVLQGGYVDLLTAEITATYTKDGAEDFVRKLTAYDYDETNFSGFDVNVAGPQAITFTFEGATATYDIRVWGGSFTDSGVTVTLAQRGKEFGVTAVTAAPSTNAYVAEAVANLLNSGYVAYDITLSYADGYQATEDTKTVTLPIPEGVTNPVVYFVSDSGKTVLDMKATVSEDGKTVSFETTHFSTYVVGDGTQIEVPNPDTATGTNTVPGEKKTVYVLASTPSDSVMIVNGNSAGSGYYAVANNNGFVAATGVTIKSGDVDGDGDTETYIELDDATDELWTVAGNYTFECEDGYLYRASSSGGTTPRIGDSATTWSYNTSNHRLSYTRNSNTYYLYYSSGWKVSTSTSYAGSIYFYVPQEIDTTTTVSGTYSIAGTDETVAAVENATVDLTSTLIFTANGNVTNPEMDSSKLSYVIYDADNDSTNGYTGDPLGIIKGSISGNVVTLTGKTGKALVKVSYESEYGPVTNYITIETTTPYKYGIELHKAEMTVATDVTADSFASGNYYVFNSKTGVYNKATEYVAGTTYYTVPVIPGVEITDPIALKGVEAGDTYSVWAIVKAYVSAEDKEGVDLGTLGGSLSWSVSDESIATINKDTGVITFTGSNYGTFNVTVSYEGAGKVITDTITISATKSMYVVPGDGTDDFPEYPNQGAVRFDKTATAVGNYSETGIAKVELSMTGVPIKQGTDVIIMLDTSSSMTKNNVEGTTKTRAQVLEESLAKLIAQLQEKDADGNYMDIKVAIADFNGYYGHGSGGTSGTPYDRTEGDYVKNGNSDGSGYSQPSNAKVYTGSENLSAGAFVTVDKLAATYTLKYPSGTNYDYAFDAIYQLGTAIKAANTEDRELIVVFMSDGASLQWNYFGTQNTYTKWNNWLAGTWKATDLTTSNLNSTAHSYFYDLNDHDGDGHINEHRMANAIKGDPNARYEIIRKATAGLPEGTLVSAGKDYLYTVPGLGATMYTINFDARQDGQITEGNIDKALASTASDRTGTTQYYYKVTKAEELENAFRTIGHAIIYAATNVEVEDKIGNKYTVNFGLPDKVTPAETGMSEFYIQAVQYQLNENKERTGEPTVLENFTFNSDGTFKSHTVNGVACSNCSHVTAINGTITAIDGTYFDYSSETETDEKGESFTEEFLHWNNEKIGSTELALQYFAYLDNSADAVGTDHEVPAGTYYTNEYATLTYDNYKGERVQQNFPVPQMTWNGAQVSYTFYLVNEAGQPVNRAGRVVPFAEAVYVTDVFTEHVIWNDLEQSAGLEADYLAKNVVPVVYSLYDNDASYNIHVYEDEEEVNLNNHFIIGGDVTDEYNTTSKRTNAKTTFVFNNKADANKYNTVGAYVADDGDTITDEKNLSYLCKGDGTISGVVFSTIENLTENDFNKNTAEGTVYYKMVDGKHVRAIQWEADTTYYVLSAATYAPVIGETQWKPGNQSYSGGTKIGEYVYYVDENGVVYTIVQKSNGTEVHKGFDFHNTTVAFAVVWKPQLEPDTVVVDYGLDVVIDVITNDGMAAGVKEVQTTQPKAEINKGTYKRDEELTTSVEVKIDEMKIGTAKVENLNSVRFSLDKTNGMQFTDPAVFYYEADVNYYDEDNVLQTDSMYSSVTVIPATTVYYEDDFLTLASFSKSGDTWAQDKTSKWTAAAQNGVQDQDRPGKSKISEDLDADNLYGHDSAYETRSTHSLNNAARITVDASTRGEATFTFYGTGFDVISTTSNTTGTLTVQVYSGAEANGNAVKTSIVDTYYGYTKNDAGEWVTSVNTPNALYQVPVMKISGLTYGQYTVKITAGWNDFFDHVDESTSYDLYLDAIRIYDPTGNQNNTANDAYVADGEAYPEYFEVRDQIISKNTFDSLNSDSVSGIVFIDGGIAEPTVAEYTSYGPNNETYLANGQAIAFELNGTYTVPSGMKLAKIQLAIKTVGGTGKVEVYGVNNGKNTPCLDETINTATDMYYDITALDGQNVVIKSTGNAIISITNVKVTYAPDENAASAASVEAEAPALFTISRASAEAAIASMTVEEDEVPETTVPEETEPETTVPEETEPEATTPEETAPEEEKNHIDNIVNEVVETIRSILDNLFGRWFR